MATIRALYGDRIKLFDNAYDAATGASALILLTEWNQYRRPNWKTLKQRLVHPLLFDGRNIWDPRFVRERDFTYYGIGRA